MIQVYIAGNYSFGGTLSREECAKNVAYHKKCFTALMKGGYAPFSPILQSHLLADEFGSGPAGWMAVDMESIHRSDMLVLAHPAGLVRANTGVTTELSAAWWLKMPIFDYVPGMHEVTQEGNMFTQGKILRPTERLACYSTQILEHVDKERPPVPLVQGPYLPWFQGQQCHVCFSRGWVVEPAHEVTSAYELIGEYPHQDKPNYTARYYRTNHYTQPERAERCTAKGCNVPKP